MRKERGKGGWAREEEDMTEQDIYVLPIDNYVDSAKASASVATGKASTLMAKSITNCITGSLR